MIASWAGLLVAWWATLWVHCGVLALGVWAVHRFGRRAGQEESEALWRVALLGGLFTATLHASSGGGLGGWTLPLPRGLSPAGLSAPVAELPVELPEVGPASPGAPSRSAARQDRTARPEALAGQGAEAAGSAMAESRSRRAGADGEPTRPQAVGLLAATPRPEAWTATAVLLAWALLVMVVSVRWWRAHCAVRRLLRGRRALDQHPLRQTLDALCRRAGWSEPVRLSVSETLCAPMSLGIWKGEIVLPRRALAPDCQRRVRALLAHELAHVMRRDGLWLRIHLLARLFCGLQPLHTLVVRRLRAIAEQRCDDRAALLCSGRVEVAGALAEVAGWLPAPRTALVSSAAGEDGRELVQRIERLLSIEPRASLAGRVLAPVAGLLIAGTCWTPGFAADSVPQGGIARPVLASAGAGPRRRDARPRNETKSGVSIELRDAAWVEWSRLAEELRALREDAAAHGDDPEVAVMLQRLQRRERVLYQLLEEWFPRPATGMDPAPVTLDSPSDELFEERRP